MKNIRSKPIILLLVGSLLVSSLVAYMSFHVDQSTEPSKSTLPQLFLTSIKPSGPVQLAIGEEQVFMANVSNPDIHLSYSWSVDSASSDNPAVNATDFLLVTCTNQATFKLLKTIAFCWLNVVTSSNSIESKARVTIQCVSEHSDKPLSQIFENEQPAQSTIAPYDSFVPSVGYIVRSDNGLFLVINGKDGSIVEECTSNSANTTLNTALTLSRIVTITSGDYNGAELIIPTNAIITADQNVTGIKYTSIADNASINEPAFNNAFGKYCAGNYTVTTNTTSSATTQRLYIAFKPDNSIHFGSAFSNFTLNNALAAGGEIIIRNGNYSGAQLIVPSAATIIAESNATGIKYNSIGDGAKIDELSFKEAFGDYNSGVYTISTNKTSNASDLTLYLAFAPGNSIYFASKNASYVFNSVSRDGLIFVKAGTYRIDTQIEPVSDSYWLAEKNVNLVSYLPANDNSVLWVGYSSMTYNVTIDGFTITSEIGSYQGIRIGNSYACKEVRIINNHITGVQFGIRCYSGKGGFNWSNIDIENNFVNNTIREAIDVTGSLNNNIIPIQSFKGVIKNNILQNIGNGSVDFVDGIQIAQIIDSNITVSGNIVFLSDESGIHVESLPRSEISIDSNVLTGNGKHFCAYGAGIVVSKCATSFVANNNITNNYDGLVLVGESSTGPVKYIAINNLIQNNKRDGFYFLRGTYTTSIDATNNVVENNGRHGLKISAMPDLGNLYDSIYFEGNTIYSNYVSLKSNQDYGEVYINPASPLKNITLNNNTISPTSPYIYSVFVSIENQGKICNGVINNTLGRGIFNAGSFEFSNNR